ncbi:MAG: sialidase family protein [Gemmatimonadaceae bacterium]
MRLPRYGPCAAALLLLGSCTFERAPLPVPAFRTVDSPAGPQSGESNLSVDATGTLHMTWLERLPDTTVALRYARRTRDAWDSTRTVAVRRDFFVNWADFPSVIQTASGRLLVHWLQRSSAGKYSYDAMLAHSDDRGLTWSDPVRLHADSSASEHGFVSLVPAGDSAMAFWLDGRAAGDHGAMQARVAYVTRDGSLGSESAVDLRTCDCCQTAGAVSSHGPIVAYRDRSESNVRDIVVSRLEDGGWSAPVKVHQDEWQIDACPVNGPAIVAFGDTVAVAWFTAARDTAKVQVAFSVDAGKSFGVPVRVDDGNPAGRIAMVRDEGSGARVVGRTPGARHGRGSNPEGSS